MDGRRGSRERTGASRALVLCALAAGLLLAREAAATFRYGDIQISGNLETQNLVRLQKTFEMQPVQQRNTFRLQYEHDLVKAGKLSRLEWHIPFIDKASLFLYYRGVYDSIYDIAPGGFLRTQDGGRATKISAIRGADRFSVGHENILREAFLDVSKSISKIPVSFRIGRQQIVWGNTLTPGVMDTQNTIDASWHANQESGLLGRVGFSETRIPFWAVKALISLETIGPFSNTFIELYDSPFQFSPTDVRQYPAPWSLPFLNPIRPGEIIDLGNADGNGGLPPGQLFAQPCFDLTGNPEPNGAAHTPASIFANAAATGRCDSIGLQKSKPLQGIYDKSDPMDVNQFGARIGFTTPFSLDMTVAYIYRRSSGADIIDNLPAKAQVGAINATQTSALGFLAQSGQPTTDPVFNTTRTPQFFIRVPTEFYYPYIHTIGGTGTYFEEFTEVVYNLEVAYRMGVPVGTLLCSGSNCGVPDANGIKKKDIASAQLLLDRQTWIRFLHPRSTFTTLFQTSVFWLRDHEKVTTDPTTGLPTNGDVGIPNSALIPRGFGELDRIDKIKEFEWYSLFAITNFYRGGTIAPLLAIISDWGNAPSLEFLMLCDIYPTNNFIVGLQGRVFTNFGRNVDEPFGIGRYSGNDEFGVKLTYQF